MIKQAHTLGSHHISFMCFCKSASQYEQKPYCGMNNQKLFQLWDFSTILPQLISLQNIQSVIFKIGYIKGRFLHILFFRHHSELYIHNDDPFCSFQLAIKYWRDEYITYTIYVHIHCWLSIKHQLMTRYSI